MAAKNLVYSLCFIGIAYGSGSGVRIDIVDFISLHSCIFEGARHRTGRSFYIGGRDMSAIGRKSIAYDLSTKVDCPAEKRVVEQVVTELPHTGSSENIIFAGIVLAVVVFFYARSRQLSTEIRLVRRNFNAGTI